MTVLVTGATGTTGAEVLDRFATRGEPVRVLVRDGRRFAQQAGGRATGVDVAIGDFDDVASLRRALDGVRAAYLTTPSSPEAAAQQKRFADAAVEAGVAHVVVLSQLAAAAHSPVRFLRWHAEVEEYLAGLPVQVTVLRPNLFLQGLLAFAPTVRAEGWFGAPIGDAPVSAIDIRDIADVAAAVLTDQAHAGRVHDLTGPQAVTHKEIAEALTDALGRPVEFRDLPPEAFRQALDAVLPEWQADGLVEDYAHYARGEAAAVSPAVEEVTGHPARDLAAFARDHAAFFRP